jgi:hypothetical protein
MTLQKFLKRIDGDEDAIINYKGKEALEVVKQDGYDLRYVKEQTEDICLEAVKQNKDALQYVDKKIFKDDRKKEKLIKK